MGRQEGFDPNRRNFIKNFALVAGGAIAGTLVGKALNKTMERSRQVDKFLASIPPRTGLIGVKPHILMSKDALDFLETNKDQMVFDRELGQIKIEAQNGAFFKLGLTQDDVKEITVVTEGDGTVIRFYNYVQRWERRRAHDCIAHGSWRTQSRKRDLHSLIAFRRGL